MDLKLNFLKPPILLIKIIFINLQNRPKNKTVIKLNFQCSINFLSNLTSVTRSKCFTGTDAVAFLIVNVFTLWHDGNINNFKLVGWNEKFIYFIAILKLKRILRSGPFSLIAPHPNVLHIVPCSGANFQSSPFDDLPLAGKQIGRTHRLNEKRCFTLIKAMSFFIVACS